MSNKKCLHLKGKSQAFRKDQPSVARPSYALNRSAAFRPYLTIGLALSGCKYQDAFFLDF